MPFYYRETGTLAAVGRAAAVAKVGNFKLSGTFAWIIWSWVRIMFLIDFRNRIMVFLEWAWSMSRISAPLG